MLNTFSLMLGTKKNVLKISTAQCNNEKIKIKGPSTGKKDVKLSLFANNVIVYTDNPKESTKKY